ncbi:MAG TPA: hypothetical protein VI636_00075 [Candidatus Angelobacter sp.]
MDSNSLSSTHFDALLQRLDGDREKAGEKYECLRKKLVMFFEWNSCSPPEDLADATLDRVAQKLGDVTVLDVIAFACGIATNIVQESHRRAMRTISISDLPHNERFLADSRQPEKELQKKLEQERRMECLRLCIQRMPEGDRNLFLRYHHSEGQSASDRIELARSLGLTIGALRVRVNRMREDLEKRVRNCCASWRLGSTRKEDRVS